MDGGVELLGLTACFVSDEVEPFENAWLHELLSGL